MYLWRFAIEHAFRFLKQHMGLNANQSTDHQDIELWMWLCALAYWQLLLIGQDAADLRPPWRRRLVDGQPKPLTPGEVQRSARIFLTRLGTPAAATRPAGKGRGRRQGERPHSPASAMRWSTRAKNAQKDQNSASGGSVSRSQHNHSRVNVQSRRVHASRVVCQL